MNLQRAPTERRGPIGAMEAHGRIGAVTAWAGRASAPPAKGSVAVERRQCGPLSAKEAQHIVDDLCKASRAEPPLAPTSMDALPDVFRDRRLHGARGAEARSQRQQRPMVRTGEARLDLSRGEGPPLAAPARRTVSLRVADGAERKADFDAARERMKILREKDPRFAPAEVPPILSGRGAVERVSELPTVRPVSPKHSKAAFAVASMRTVKSSWSQEAGRRIELPAAP